MREDGNKWKGTYHLVFIFNVDVVDPRPFRWRAYLLRVVLICVQFIVVRVSGHKGRGHGSCQQQVTSNNNKQNSKHSQVREKVRSFKQSQLQQKERPFAGGKLK